jgi:hypothetical protein
MRTLSIVEDSSVVSEGPRTARCAATGCRTLRDRGTSLGEWGPDLVPDEPLALSPSPSRLTLTVSVKSRGD